MNISLPVKLFLYLLKILHKQNPILLMSEEETIPEQFCIGMSTPMTCVFYDPRDSKNILDSLQVSKNSPIFLSQGDHRDLMVEFSSAPILFSRTSMWFMPIEYGSDIPLRLDSRVFLYDGNYTVYESYAVRGGPPVIRRLLEWSPEDATSDATVFEKRSILRGSTAGFWVYKSIP